MFLLEVFFFPPLASRSPHFPGFPLTFLVGSPLSSLWVSIHLPLPQLFGIPWVLSSVFPSALVMPFVFFCMQCVFSKERMFNMAGLDELI